MPRIESASLMLPLIGLCLLSAPAMGGPRTAQDSATSASAPLIAPGATVKRIQGGFRFLEGPAARPNGDLVFSDPLDSKVYRLPLGGKISLLRENTDKDNGQYFDAAGNLISCATTARAVVSIAPDGVRSIVADKFEGKPFNSPNDLWIDPKGGIYFSDPRYGMPEIGAMEQGGEHVYYIRPDRKSVIRVADDLEKPNGLIGTDDGRILYVADHRANKTFAYDVQADATLANKRLFASQGSDGVTMDERGNLYLTSLDVKIFSPAGDLLETITMPENPDLPPSNRGRSEAPANVTFAGKDRKTLYICARTSLYSLEMNVKGHKVAAETAVSAK